MNKLALSPDGKMLRVTSEYNADLVTRFRTIKELCYTKHKVRNAGWYDKAWNFPLIVYIDVKEALRSAGDYEIDEAVTMAYDNMILAQERARTVENEYQRRTQQMREQALRRLQLDRPLADGRTLFVHQQEAVKVLVKAGRFILADDMGLGKLHACSTKVLTPNGWHEIGSLVVGDCVIGSNGQPTRVTGVFPQGVKDNYRLYFSDHSSVEAGDEHLWTVGYWRGGKTFATLTLTTEQLRTGAIIEQTRPDGQKSYLNLSKTPLYLPMLSAPVEFNSQAALPLPPYLLGALIANGYLKPSAPVISSNALDSDEIEDRLRREFVGYRRTEYGTVTRFRIPGISALIEGLGLDCLSADKFIPRIYLQATPTERIALLHGLMDGDGSISKANNRLTYHTISVQLAADVQELVEGLGGIASIREYDRSHEDKPTEYQIRLRLPSGIKPFSTKRKLDRYKPGRLALPTRSFVRAEFSRSVESVCIRVEADDHLYVTEHCILTHNTTTALVSAAAFDLPIHVLAPAGLRQNWRNESAATGIAIDTVHSWAKIPKEIKGDYILIADEAHYAQSLKAARTKAFLTLCKQKNCVGVFLLTGTPIKNGQPQHYFPLLVAVGHELSKDKHYYDERYCDAHSTRWTAWDTSGASNMIELHEKTRNVMLRRTKDKVLDLPEKLRQMRFIDFDAEQDEIYRRSRAEDVEIYRRTKLHKLLGDSMEDMTDQEITEAFEHVTEDDLLALSLLMADRKAASRAKTKSAIELAEEVVEQGGQIVLFTMFKETAEKIAGAFGKYGATITSDTKNRQEVVDKFQRGEYTVIASTFGAGNVGFTMTAAQTVVLVDRPWTPGDAVQSEDRLHRIGQKQTVYAVWLQCDGTDKAIDELLARKELRINKILEGKAKTLRGVADGILDIAREVAEQMKMEI